MYALINFFSFTLIASTISVISVRNPLHSVLSLILSFLSASILLFLFENEFLSLFFLIIYLGAIAVLFLFVVMMLNLKYREFQNSKLYLPVGALIGLTVFMEMWGSFSKIFRSNTSSLSVEHNLYENRLEMIDSVSDIQAIGQIFYTYYPLQILIVGLILYVAVIGVAFLTVEPISKSVAMTKRTQHIFRQLSRKSVL